MKRGKTFAGTVALAAIIALSWLLVPTAAADGQGIPGVLKSLTEILANQAALLEQVNICTAPDLVPIPDPNPFVNFCRFDDQGRLLVHVHNQGGASAGASEALLEFRTSGGGAALFVPTPALPGFTGTDLVVDIPEGCFGNFISQDDNNVCKFQILVDVFIESGSVVSPVGRVLESNEANNTAVVACQGLL
jgi:hypothetical protein